MNVITPKPRKAKKVSATLETMSPKDGYPEKASRSRSRLLKVAIEKTVRMPTTTITTTVCALATVWSPRMLSTVITRMISTANGLIQSSLSATAALA